MGEKFKKQSGKQTNGWKHDKKWVKPSLTGWKPF